MAVDRRFIVSKYGMGAIIREVEATSCAHTLDRPTAWHMARNIAAARRRGIPKPAGHIHFVDLDLNETLIKESS